MEFYGTLGPACADEAILDALFDAGMTGVRLNLSHAGLKASESWLDTFRQAASRAGKPVSLLIDLQGPELRTQNSAPLQLHEGTRIGLGTELPVPPILFSALEPGAALLLDDGAFLLRVTARRPEQIECRIERGGLLLPRKSIAAPGTALYPPTLTEADLENLSRAAEYGVTGVMLPFVRSAADLLCLRQVLEKAPHIRIFAKLENRAGVEKLPELLPHADEIVIARGDLGNDMPLWELPAVQKKVSAQCRAGGEPFMVVTQLLHSMQHSAVPTRAEVSDIFNAVLDGASSLMLTGETAVGKYPVEAMQYLCRTAKEALRVMDGDTAPDEE